MKNMIMRVGAIGDVLQTLPLVQLMRREDPQCQIIYLTSESLQELLTFVPEINYVETIDLRSNLWKLSKRASEIHKVHNPERFINLHSGIKASLVASLSGGKVLSYVKSGGDLLVWKDFASTVFSMASVEGHNPELPALTLQTIPTGRVAIFPGVGIHRSARAWPVAHWIELMLNLPDESFVLIGGPDEVDLAKFIGQEVNHKVYEVENLCGKLSLLDTARTIAGCKFAIGADTGPTHLAAALMVPTLALFGPTSAKRHAPLYGKALSTVTGCDRNCSPKMCVLTEDANCMNQLTPGRVIEELKGFFAEFKPQSNP